MLETPVVLIIFNRPDLTKIVFEAIRKAQPEKLLVIADGPRHNKVGEFEKCEAARSIIKLVDWDCKVISNFSQVNMGCRSRVSSGLNWVFSEVEEAIILEDDCLPAPSFFQFCKSLLQHYRYDERVMMISGNNFFDDKDNTLKNQSYYFSKYSHVWGWASWRRAWQHYDVEMKTWSEYKKLNLINSVCDDSRERQYWTDVFDKVFEGYIDTWDYQWLYTHWQQSGLAVLPTRNLVSNLGFRADATHTLHENSLSNLPTNDLWELIHPPFVVRNKTAELYTFENIFTEQITRSILIKKILSKVRKLLSSK